MTSNKKHRTHRSVKFIYKKKKWILIQLIYKIQAVKFNNSIVRNEKMKSKENRHQIADFEVTKQVPSS